MDTQNQDFEIPFSHILVIEDDKILNQLIQKSLIREGYEVLCAFDAKEAHKIIKENNNCLLLLDYILPDKHANEFIAELKNSNTPCPFIITTGYGDEKLAVEMMQMGAYDYIVKDTAFLEVLIPHIKKIEKQLIAELTLERAKQELRISEEKYRLLFNNMPSGFQLNEVIVDNNSIPVDFRFIDGNNNMKIFTGFSIEEVRGKTIKEVIPEADTQMIKQYGNVGLTGEPFNIEYYSQTFNKYFRVNTYSPKEGQFACIFEDITESKLAEETLKQSQERLQKIINDTDAGYFFIDNMGNYQQVNPAWVKMHKYESASEIIGKHFSLTQIESDQADANAIVNQMLSGEKILTGEFSRKCKDGTIGYHTFSSRPVENAGKIIGLEGFIIDITQRKKAEKELKESEEKLRAIYQAIPLPTYTWKAAGTDFILIDFNNAALKITSGRVEDMLGTKVRDMYSDDIDIINKITHCYKERISIEHEIDYKFKSTGEHKYLNVKYAFAPPDLVIVHTDDISERKKAEVALKEKAEEIQRFNNLMVGREIKMIELKREINELLVKSGEKPRYKILQKRDLKLD